MVRIHKSKKGQTSNYKIANNDQHQSSPINNPFSNWCMTIWKGWNE